MADKSLRREDDGDWIVVAHAYGMNHAEIVAGLLRSFDIPVFMQREGAGPAIGITIGALGLIRLLVPAKYEQAAVLLLEEEEDDPSTLLDEPGIIFPDGYDDDDEYEENYKVKKTIKRI